MDNQLANLLRAKNAESQQLGIELAKAKNFTNWDILECLCLDMEYHKNAFWLAQQNLLIQTRIIIQTDIDINPQNQLGTTIILYKIATEFKIDLYFYKHSNTYKAEYGKLLSADNNKIGFDNLKKLITWFNKMDIF